MSRESLSILGFGNQAKAWALNLSDSNIKSTIILREGSIDIDVIEKLNLTREVLDPKKPPLTLAMLIPDDQQFNFLINHGHEIPKGSILLYAHGYAVTRFELEKKFPDFIHVLFAPKAIAVELRQRFLQKKSLGGVYSLEHVPSNRKNEIKEKLFSLAKSLGLGNHLYETTFSQETKADLFSEQALLCSLIPYGVKACYELMIRKGLSPELCYLEIWAELELIVKALVEVGPEKFFSLISPNALVGAQKGQQLLIDDTFKEKLNSLYEDIEHLRFDQELDQTNILKLRESMMKEWQQSSLSSLVKKIQEQK